MKKYLQEYLVERNAEMIDGLKRDASKLAAIDERILECKRRTSSNATKEIPSIGSATSEPPADTKLLESSSVEPLVSLSFWDFRV